MSKLFFFDLETTGVKFWKNGVHQIAGVIEIDGEVKEEFNFNVRPYKDAVIEDEALAIAGVTKDQIMAYEKMEEIHYQLTSMLGKYCDKFNKKDKFHLVGYNNASFDNQFLRAFFTQCSDNYFGSWFWSDSLDVMVLASQKLICERHQLENFKLKTVAAHLGIELDETKLHDALYDINLTRSIYRKINGISDAKPSQDKTNEMKLLAKKLNGREYGDEITHEESLKAKQNGLVVVYGSSDDLMEFDGAIEDEISAYDGVIAYITKQGKIVQDEDDREILIENGIVFNQIEAVWSPEELNYSWLIKTDIPHETFDIFEDGEPFCRGLVFSINDLK